MDVAFERGYPTPFSNSPLLPLLILSLARQKHTPKITTEFEQEYDYVVVGGGSAGSVIAGRLSEEKCVTILLLESGKNPPVVSEVPAISRNFVNTDLDWQYKTVPQKHTGKFLVNREVPWPSGKGLGGSSIFSAMIFSRGNRKNYDDWEAQGAEGWSFKDVKPYFRKLENHTDSDSLSNGHHSSGGPMNIQKPRYQAKIQKPILEAIKEHNYNMIDIHSDRNIGFDDFHAIMRDGQRCTTAKGYLVPAESRRNLDIVSRAHVRKVIIEGTKATGVEFDHNGSTQTVRARREVIMAAGAINTPQLLMLSGIGPREHLEELEIPVVADLPVGKNFHDHASVPLSFELDDSIPTTHERVKNLRNINEYIHNRTGPLASAQFTSVVGFVNTESDASEEEFPTSQLWFAELTTKLPRTQIGLKREVFKQIFEPYQGKPFFICGAHALQPKSRGTVKLFSSAPYDTPLIDPNYFEDPKDLEETVKALKICLELSTSEPMKKVGAKLFSTPVPGCEDVRDDTDRFLECFARGLVVTMSDPVGTCKMGRSSDPTTVVDPQLKVKGIDGLRVVDASVMPTIPSGNLHIPTVMVAEKAADIIKETIQCSKEESDNSLHAAFFEDN